MEKTSFKCNVKQSERVSNIIEKNLSIKFLEIKHKKYIKFSGNSAVLLQKDRKLDTFTKEKLIHFWQP